MTVITSLIVAVAKNGVIGRNGGLPWRMSSDLKTFRRLTMGKPIVMGRKTFQSIGKPLDGRDNIVVSRDPIFAPEGVTVFSDLGEALVRAHFDLRPYGIIRMLDLVHPMYRATAAYGHFGREPVHMTYEWKEFIAGRKVDKSEAFTAFTWEKTDRAADLKKAAGRV